MSERHEHEHGHERDRTVQPEEVGVFRASQTHNRPSRRSGPVSGEELASDAGAGLQDRSSPPVQPAEGPRDPAYE